MPLLSKSKYMIGLTCPKYLWIAFNEKQRIAEISEDQQHLFDQGKLVGELAKKLFPKGIDIPTQPFAENLEKSQAAAKLARRRPLFEAAFSIDNVYSRADILNPVGKDEWDIIEVKSSTEVKDEHIQDVSFQKFCYERVGLKIRKCFMLVINNEYAKKGKVDPKKLFKFEDITERVAEEIKGMEERIEEMFKIINLKKCPETEIHEKCKKPYDCPLVEQCWRFLPKNSVFNLYSGGAKCFELFRKGIQAIKDIPDEYELTDRQDIQRRCEKTGKPYVQKEHIKHFLESLKYPLYFMDFETYNTAIPLYNKLKPYQNIPFQFSMHVLKAPGEKLEHYSFLAEGSKDPRKKFAEALKKAAGRKGSVVVYNAAFETGVLKKIKESFPKNSKWVDAVTNRVVDLLQPFRNFWYYNPRQQGKASLKAVLPALVGKSYEGMEIAEGGNASRRYLFITHGSIDGTKATPEEAKQVRHHLEAYCGMDTEAMVWILDALRNIVNV